MKARPNAGGLEVPRLILGKCNIDVSPVDGQGHQDIHLNTANGNNKLTVAEDGIGVIVGAGLQVDGGVESIFNTSLHCREEVHLDKDLIEDGKIHVGHVDIEGGGANRISTDNGSALLIANDAPSGNVSIAKYANSTTVGGALSAARDCSFGNLQLTIVENTSGVNRVTIQDTNEAGAIDADGDLALGANAPTGNVIIGRSNEGSKTTIISPLTVGPDDGDGLIDSGGTEETPRDLKIGTGAATNDVIIAKEDQTTIIDCNLRVGRSLVGAVHTSRIDAYGSGGNPDSLLIGTLEHTSAVSIGRSTYKTTVKGDLDVKENLKVGPIEAEGYIDAGGTPGEPQDLGIGTSTVTSNNVILSRTGQITDVKGRLDAEEHIRVGTAANDGKVDAAANNRTLKIGTDANLTNAVEIASANKTTTIKGNVNVSSKRIYLDAGSLYWIVYNPAGHAVPPPVRPSIDFAVNGIVHFYVDDLGGHSI